MGGRDERPAKSAMSPSKERAPELAKIPLSDSVRCSGAGKTTVAGKFARPLKGAYIRCATDQTRLDREAPTQSTGLGGADAVPQQELRAGPCRQAA
jgi:hypothetical protein